MYLHWGQHLLKNTHLLLDTALHGGGPRPYQGTEVVLAPLFPSSLMAGGHRLPAVLSLLAFSWEEVVLQYTFCGGFEFFKFCMIHAFFISLFILTMCCMYPSLWKSSCSKNKIIRFLYYSGDRKCIFGGIHHFCYHKWQNFSLNYYNWVWVFNKFCVTIWFFF